MEPRALLIGLVAAATLAAPALAQIQLQPRSDYEAQYGEPIDVSISDLALSPGGYEGRAVRTRGRLEIDVQSSQRVYALSGGVNDRVLVMPVGEIATQFEFEVSSMLGQELEVTGVFWRDSQYGGGSTLGQSVGRVQFWSFVGPDAPAKGKLEAPSVSLETLVTNAGKHDGRLVRVVGQFRGKNLFGDLPVKSRLGGSDWVLKDDLFAVWITRKKPKGDGFSLDAALKRDSGKWLEVVGRVSVRSGVTYLEAQSVRLATAPSPTAKALPPPPPPERPKRSPVVVFALPLDGETVAGDARFAVQFSKDMDEESFKGHVLFRYAGPTLPGDREFDGLLLRYDGGRRALIVEPGDRLRPGRQVELMLLPGIVDIDGLALTSRSGPAADATAPVDVLRYRIGFF